MSECLGNFCTLQGGTGFPERLQGHKEGDLAFIKVSDMSLPGNQRAITAANNYVNKAIAEQLGANVFPPQATVFAKVGAALLLNRRRMLTEPTIIDNNMMAAVPTRTEPGFLYHFLCSIDFENYVQVGALPSINQTVIGSIPFPEFELAQQRRIAKILTTLDETIEQTEALIAKYQQIKAGLMHDLFTRGVTPDGRLRPTRDQAPHLYKDSPLGWIPKEWDCQKLGTLAEIVSGVTLGSKKEINDELGVPYLRVANVQDGYFDLQEIKTIQVSRSQFEKLQLRAGDVLMNEGGDFDKLGRGSVWQEEIKPCIHQNHVFRVRPKSDKLRSYFLAFWSQSEMGKQYFLLNSKQSTNLASINSSQLYRFPVALPSATEQERIEERVGAVNGSTESLEQELSKLRKQKSGLMHDLLTGRVRVKVAEAAA